MAPQTAKRNFKNVFTEQEARASSILKNYLPKTKLSARDKSQDHSSSPRLKSFPAEKIKKIDGTTLLQTSMPQLNYNNVQSNTSNPEQNIGHGDALSSAQQIQITPRHKPQIISMSQQNVPHFQQAGNTNQSEAILSSQRPITPEVQSHRPFVPNLPQGSTIRGVSPKKQITPRPIISHMPSFHHVDSRKQQNYDQSKFNEKEQGTQKLEETFHQKSSLFSPEISEPNYEKQPVGGRISALHRQALLENKPICQKKIADNQLQQPIQQPFQQLLPTRPNVVPVTNNPVHVWPNPCQHPVASKIEGVEQQIQPSAQQMYQRLYYNAANQEQMQQRAMAHQHQMMMNEMQQKAYYDYYNQYHQRYHDTSPGMTSPQDLSINQERIHQAHIHPTQTLSANQGFPQNPISSSKQLNPFAIDMVTPYSKQHKIQSPQWQQPVHTNQNCLQNKQNSFQSNQVNLHSNQNSHQQMHFATHQQEPSIPQEQKPKPEKKVYHFTPDMIKDQEHLIATMQQQRIPEEVMRRQFLALLFEQKKQLAYLEQFVQNDESVEETATKSVSKKITKAKFDEKPEWMAHITPPRISYSDMEKLKNDCSLVQKFESKQQNMNQNSGTQHQHHQFHQDQVQNHQYQMQHQHQPCLHQNQQEHEQQVLYNHNQGKIEQHQIEHQNLNQHEMQHQQNQYKTWQHQMLGYQRNSGNPVTSSYSYPPLHNTTSPNHLQFQNFQYNYPSQYHELFYPQPQQKMYQNSQSEMTPDRSEGNFKKVEPSSLLQLRINKKAIQTMKRNNGLQDPETVKEALEALKNTENKKGLEYLVNINNKKVEVRLNGIQEPDEVPEDFLQRPPESFHQIPKQISANGLENKRNPNNPLLPSVKKIRHQENQLTEYPPSKRSQQPQKYTCVAEKENGSVAPYSLCHQYSQPDNVYNQVSSLYSMQNPGDHQHLYTNRQILASSGQNDVSQVKEISRNAHLYQAGDQQNNKIPLGQYGGVMMKPTEIQEPKIIGGVTYLARKPSYIPSPQVPTQYFSDSNYTLPHAVS